MSDVLAGVARRHARNPVTPCGGGHLHHRLGLCRIRFQISKLKLKLIEQRSPFRGLTKPIVPQLPDRELELLDQ